jgi:HAMP domain-containing protein
MLRKKLMMRLGLLVVGFVAGAVVSIVLLQNVLQDLDALSADAVAMIDGTRNLSSDVEAINDAARTGNEVDSARVSSLATQLLSGLNSLGVLPTVQQSGPEILRSHERAIAIASRLIQPRATPALSPEARSALAADALALRDEVSTLSRLSRAHVAAEQIALSHRLRRLIIGLTLAALVMVNITVVVLLRTAGMILRPVDELVEASRQLAKERFDSRIRVDQNDEFAELARSYNSLAEQLSTNEGRKVEALRQLAVTLNHEINNAIATIDLQLALLNRKSQGDPALTGKLQGIHTHLARISSVITSLKNVRRVVLTDYGPGQKMIDLPRSIAEGDDIAIGIIEPKHEVVP